MPAAAHITPQKTCEGDARAFWWGIAFWTLICLVAVLVRGVRWEEGYERAQVLLGITPYPDGHPHAQWYWNGFSIHYYASAALLWLTDSAAAVCGSRQFLAALAVHLPVFGITWLLTRRASAAHFATLLSVVGAITVFQSYMPIAPWANKATSGMIGIGWAFWVLAAMCAGRWRLAGALFGLMPLVHIGQWPMILVTAMVWLVWMWATGHQSATKPFLVCAVAGLLCCGAFALAQRPFMVAMPEMGAYTGGRDGGVVWAEYVTFEDMHRAPVSWPRFGPFGNSIMAMAGFLLLAFPLAWREAREKSARPTAAVLFTYGLLCVSAIAFAQVVHRLMGVDVPYLVVGWMPNRLTIHLAMLLLCVVCSYLFRRGDETIPWVAIGGVAWLAVLPLWPAFFDGEWVHRYFSATEAAIFLAAGAALLPAWHTLAGEKGVRWIWGAYLCAGLLSLLWYHHFGGALVIVGFVVALAERLLRAPSQPPLRVWTTAIVSLLGIVVLLEALWIEGLSREFLPVSPFEAEVAAYLDAHSAPGDLVLTPLDERYQMVLNQPVVATFETRQHIGYMHALASATDKLYADIYGVKDGHWYDWNLMMARSEAEWRALGRAYGFRFVLINEIYPLHLPQRLSGEGLTFYEIPGVSD